MMGRVPPDLDALYHRQGTGGQCEVLAPDRIASTPRMRVQGIGKGAAWSGPSRVTLRRGPERRERPTWVDVPTITHLLSPGRSYVNGSFGQNVSHWEGEAMCMLSSLAPPPQSSVRNFHCLNTYKQPSRQPAPFLSVTLLCRFEGKYWQRGKKNSPLSVDPLKCKNVYLWLRR